MSVYGPPFHTIHPPTRRIFVFCLMAIVTGLIDDVIVVRKRHRGGKVEPEQRGRVNVSPGCKVNSCVVRYEVHHTQCSLWEASNSEMRDIGLWLVRCWDEHQGQMLQYRVIWIAASNNYGVKTASVGRQGLVDAGKAWSSPMLVRSS